MSSIEHTTDFGSNGPNVSSETIGLSGKSFVVHKTGEEGGLLIDAMSGAVLPNQPDRPEWSQGYAMAQLVERHGYYAKRLGVQFADTMKQPEAFNADDLAWLGLDEEGQEVEIAASTEYRSQVLKDVLVAAGIIADTDTADVQEIIDGPGIVSYQTTVDIDRERTAEEISAIEKAASTNFEDLLKTSNG